MLIVICRSSTTQHNAQRDISNIVTRGNEAARPLAQHDDTPHTQMIVSKYFLWAPLFTFVACMHLFHSKLVWKTQKRASHSNQTCLKSMSHRHKQLSFMYTRRGQPTTLLEQQDLTQMVYSFSPNASPVHLCTVGEYSFPPWLRCYSDKVTAVLLLALTHFEWPIPIVNWHFVFYLT